MDATPRDGAEIPDESREASSLLDDWLASAGDADPAAAAAPEPDGSGPAIEGAPSLLDALATSDAGVAIERAVAPVESPRRARVDRFVLFKAGASTYAVAEAFVIEVERVPKITPVPRVPVWLRGVTNLRGDVVSVIDMRTLLGLDPAPLHSGRLLVVRLVDEDFSVGLLVDAVDQIAGVPPEDIRPPAAPLEGPLATYFTGGCRLGDRLVAVIDLGRLLRSPEIRQFDDRRDLDAAR